ncbi:MAG: DUF1674 domain-containing protein [Gammaproteobacteria bacterium]
MDRKDINTDAAESPQADEQRIKPDTKVDSSTPAEINGPKGPEPTRFGDWERKGRCVDF